MQSVRSPAQQAQPWPRRRPPLSLLLERARGRRLPSQPGNACLASALGHGSGPPSPHGLASPRGAPCEAARARPAARLALETVLSAEQSVADSAAADAAPLWGSAAAEAALEATWMAPPLGESAATQVAPQPALPRQMPHRQHPDGRTEPHSVLAKVVALMRLSAGVYSYLETDLLPRCTDLPSSGRPADLVPAMVRQSVRLKSARSLPAALGRRGRSLQRAAPSPAATRCRRRRCKQSRCRARSPSSPGALRRGALPAASAHRCIVERQTS